MPQYYYNQINYLVPVEILGTTMALVVEKLPNNKYITIDLLDLNTAYRNARLIMNPETEWLKIKRDKR